MNMDMQTSLLQYRTKVMPQSVHANQLAIKQHIPEDQTPHVLREFASVTGYGIHFLWMTVYMRQS